ncbi:hypothetical protein DRE23_08950 [Salmonella enterica subsp. enterica]|nr:hypothetical protein [Salmonella enterica subsp. enterica serovar Schwarzengrund]ECB0695818.1 hypothetical protein [Salmonella enterica subsp. enterica serovar Poona]ECG2244864.1 hypothetical protein [Salmonella enterica subsp. enterica serovar Poona]ECI4748808.1 hypothetical protein [Salmonella enterica subsp. enterica]
MKVKITKSNSSFVSVGEITDVETNPDGTQILWSHFCKRYERVSWCKNVFGVEYEEIHEPPGE